MTALPPDLEAQLSSALYKAVRPDGTDFYTGTVQWARIGEEVKHPTSEAPVLGDFSTFLSVSTDPTRLPGSSWPLRLLRVEPVGDLIEVDEHKRGGIAFRVVEELPAHLRFGPMGERVAELIDRARHLTRDEVTSLAAVWAAAGAAAWDAARAAAWDAAGAAARDAAWDAAGAAAWAAAGALAVRDLIGQHGFTQEHYDTLTLPWRTTIGRIHPDDAEVTA